MVKICKVKKAQLLVAVVAESTCNLFVLLLCLCDELRTAESH